MRSAGEDVPVSPKADKAAARPVVTLDVGAATDVGHKRASNEDSCLTGYPIFAVADGMGGHDAGDRASQAVIQQLSVLVGEREIQPLMLVAALETARASVVAISDETARGAGSTVAGVAVSVHQGVPSWLVFNIGDSRIYRLRDSELAQLSVDHSLVQELLDRGQISPDEVANFHGKNVITRAVGADDSNADFWLHPIVQNERLLLCSDGLTGEVSDDDIAELLRSTSGAQATAQALVQRALDNGGGDNVTAVVLDVREGGVSQLEVDVEQHAQRPPDNASADTIELPRAKAARKKGDN